MTSSNAKRTAARESAAWQFRYDLCAEVGRCERCTRRKPTNELSCHEILDGNGFRQKCLTERCALLVLCNPCHAIVQNEPKPRQLARLYLSRAADLDLIRLCELWCRAPTAVTVEDVMAQVDLILEGK
jgi:hypothetical protein